MNDHLTKQNGDIARKAGSLKKEGKIQSPWTNNCKIFCNLNRTPEQAKVMVIRNVKELEVYQWSP